MLMGFRNLFISNKDNINFLDNSGHIDYLVLTNAVEPYAYHNKYYLSLLSGLAYKFRYPKKYIHPDIETSKLEGKSGCLVLRNFKTGDLIPLRIFKIYKVYDYGKHVFFKFAFGEFVKYPNENFYNYEKEKIELLQGHYTESVETCFPDKVVNEPNKEMTYEIFPVKGKLEIKLCNSSDVSEVANSWTNLTYILSTLDVFKKESFYLISNISRIKGLKIKNISPQEIPNEEKGLKVIAGNIYRIDFMQLSPRNSEYFENYKLNFNSISTHFEFLQNEYTIDGGFDRFNITFSVLPQNSQRVMSKILINEERVSNNTVQILPDFEIPIIIKWSFLSTIWRKFVMPVAFLLAVILWVFAESLIEFSVIRSLGIKVDYLRYISIFLLSFSLQNWGSFIRTFRINPESNR